MLFNSLIFILFLPLVFFIHWAIPIKFRNYFLLLASYYFYFSYNPWFLLLLIGTSAFDFWCAQKIGDTEDQRKKKGLLLLSVFSNIGILVAFKYSAFIYNSFSQIFNSSGSLMEQLIIPAGLSFYTFQSLSYTIDIYRGKYKPNDTLYEFLLYVSFFPHMVAGPIVRYNSLMPQLKQARHFNTIDWGSFARLAIWGYFKKLVIADNLNLLVSSVFNSPSSFTGCELLIAGFLFVVQVYCDFSGYSDIATGVAKLFGIDLSLNWRRPLLSRSLHDFWQRNHISITTWFRDYLYIGLGGSRVTYLRWLLNIFLVFLISGLWHGASFTFLIWGAMHGCMYIIEILIKKKWPSLSFPYIVGWCFLIVFHTVSLIAFRSNSVADLKTIYSHVFAPVTGYFEVPHLLSYQTSFYYLIMTVCIAILFLKELHEEFGPFHQFQFIYKPLRATAYILFVILIFILGNFSANTFIYFQF